MSRYKNDNFYSSYTGEEIDLAIKLLTTQIAVTFDSTDTYKKNDVVIYDGFLYEYISDEATTGEFVQSRWQKMKLFDENGYWIYTSGGAFENSRQQDSTVITTSVYSARISGNTLYLE